MAEAGVTRIGKAAPGSVSNDGYVEELDPTPVVLWSGSAPAAVLTYKRHGEKEGPGAWEEFAVIPESLAGRRANGFPYTVKIRRSFLERGVATPETVEAGRVITADVDGDGTDELIVPRRHGAVDLLSLKGPLPRFDGPTASHALAGYAPVYSQVARLPGREVVHLLLRRDTYGDASEKELVRIGAGDPFLLVRVDAKGGHPVRITGKDFLPADVLALDGVNLPGSKEVDELLLLSRLDASADLYLSRHRPDGALIDKPRKLYVPTAFGADWSFQGWKFHFLPQSRTAVLAATGYPRVYFLEPAKPANWVRAVELDATVKKGEWVDQLGAVGADATARALLLAEGLVYSVDVEGRFFTPAGPSPKPAPFYSVKAPGPGFDRPIVVPAHDRADDLLIVHHRKRQTKELSRDDLHAAAERFLLPGELARIRRRNEPSLQGRDPVRDRLIREERAKRMEEREIASMEEWKSLLPDSYAAYLEDQAAGLSSNLESSLTFPLDQPTALRADNYRDPEGLRAWLAALNVPPEVDFHVVQGGTLVRSARVPAELGTSEGTELTGLPHVAWRRDVAGDTIVTALTLPETGAVPHSGIFLVRTASASR